MAVTVAASGAGLWLFAGGLFAQEQTPVFRSKVDLVVLSFTVTDNKGKYVNGLKPADFKVLENVTSFLLPGLTWLFSIF